MVKAFALAASTCVVVGCHRDPRIAYAHLLERAASWAASARFANELTMRGDAPRTYLHDVLSTGAGEVDAIRKQIGDDEDVPASDRSRAAEACERLASSLREADRQTAIADDGPLRAIEATLRAEAERTRAGETIESRR